jgi:hypothetical protein
MVRVAGEIGTSWIVWKNRERYGSPWFAMMRCVLPARLVACEIGAVAPAAVAMLAIVVLAVTPGTFANICAAVLPTRPFQPSSFARLIHVPTVSIRTFGFSSCELARRFQRPSNASSVASSRVICRATKSPSSVSPHASLIAPSAVEPFRFGVECGMRIEKGD